MKPEDSPPTVLFISPDLLFAGKIQAAARPLGMQVSQETSLPAIEQAIARPNLAAVLLDLNVTTPTLSEVMGCLPGESPPLTVAFGPHVNTKGLEEARNAGCEHVLPRSRFVNELPDLLRTAIDRLESKK